MMPKRKIFFVSYGGGHIDIVLQILPYLRAFDDIDPVVLALTTAAPKMQAAGIGFRHISEYCGLKGYENASDIGADLSRPIWLQDSGITWEDSCAYLGVSMIDLINECGNEEASRRYDSHGRYTFLPKAFLRKVLMEEKPHIVVTTCSVRMERAAVLASRELGIKTVCIDDLFGNAMLRLNEEKGELELEPDCYWPDWLCVLNKKVKLNLEKRGFPGARIVSLGQPVFSDWPSKYLSAGLPENLKDWVDEDQKMIAYFSPAQRDLLTEQSRMLVALFRKTPEWRLVIKLHPSVSEKEFENLIPNTPENVRAISGSNIDEIIKCSDLSIVRQSTVGVLCLLIGEPVIVFDTSNSVEWIPFSTFSGAVIVSEFDRLEEVIIASLEKRQEAACVSSEELENPVNASTNIADWLRTIALES